MLKVMARTNPGKQPRGIIKTLADTSTQMSCFFFVAEEAIRVMVIDGNQVPSALAIGQDFLFKNGSEGIDTLRPRMFETTKGAISALKRFKLPKEVETQLVKSFKAREMCFFDLKGGA